MRSKRRLKIELDPRSKSLLQLRLILLQCQLVGAAEEVAWMGLVVVVGVAQIEDVVVDAALVVALASMVQRVRS